MNKQLLGFCALTMSLFCYQGKAQQTNQAKVYITKAVSAKMDSVDAYYGEAIVMDVESGKVVADVQLSRKDRFGNGDLKTDSCSEYIGTLIQPAILQLALNNGISLTKKYDTGDGIKAFDGDTIRDHNWHRGGYGVLTVERGFEVSSHILFASLATDIYGKDAKRLSDDLKPLKLDDTDTTKGVTYIATGYANKLRTIQILSYYNSIAKDGSKEVKAALQAYVEKGLGKFARTNAISTAGKSSTTVIYSKGDTYKYQIGFCGYFPADKPKYSVIVIMKKQDKPASGSVCASVFRDIAEYQSK